MIDKESPAGSWKQAAEIERLREAGTKLAGFAGHDSECEDVTGAYHGFCSCGYSRAWKAWNDATGETVGGNLTEREESATETQPAEEILPSGKNEETSNEV